MGRRHRGLVVLASSAAAAAGVSVIQRLIRQGPSERSVQDRRYRIDPGRGSAEEVRRIASGQLELALDELNGHPGDSEAVHEARKALKRCRALLRVTRHLLGQDVFRRENRNLRDAGRALSQSRDAQVLMETVESLGAASNGSLPEGSVDRLRVAVSTESERARDIDQAPALWAISRTCSRVPGWPLPAEGDLGALAPGIRRIYRQGRRALARVGQEPADERWHELRKRSKDLWHAAQLLEAARPEEMRKVAKRAHRLADLLGEDHDLAVLQERVSSSRLAPDDRALVSQMIDRRRDELHHEAQRVARRLYRRKPGKFVRRVGLA
jgi:CHAD domain-containing protein